MHASKYICKGSLDYLLGAIPAGGVGAAVAAPYVPKQHRPPTKDIVAAADPANMILTPLGLNRHFRDAALSPPTPGQISRAQQFFNAAKVKLDWTHNAYADIPDVKVERLQQQRRERVAQAESHLQYHRTAAVSRKLFGVPPDLLRPLPEVLLLGGTNVGKSTLVNTLLLSRQDALLAGAVTEHAFVSRRAGYTKTLNCFNAGNKIRVVDTPGYGQFGEATQGQAVMDYIEQRRQLRTVFLLVDGLRGFSELDQQIMAFLVQLGVPFDVVFTKIDQVVHAMLPKSLKTLRRRDIESMAEEDVAKNAILVAETNDRMVSHFERLVTNTRLRQVATLPRIYFNNGLVTPVLRERLGYKEIRYAILQSCGIL